MRKEPDTPMNHPAIIPTIRYKDAPKAISWLRDAFGFEEHLVVPGDNSMEQYGNPAVTHFDFCQG